MQECGRGVLQVGRPSFHLQSILHVEYLNPSTTVDRGAGGVAREDPCCVITYVNRLPFCEYV